MERNRFDKEDYIVYKVVEVKQFEDYMLLENIADNRRVSAQISCHHSYGSRFTILTYKLDPNHPYVLFYEQES